MLSRCISLDSFVTTEKHALTETVFLPLSKLAVKESPLLTLTVDLDRPAAMNSLIRDRGNEVTQKSERRDQAADVVTARDPALLVTHEIRDPMESTGTTGTGTETTGITGSTETGRGTIGITETVVVITATATKETAEEVDPVSAALVGAGVQGASVVEGE